MSNSARLQLGFSPLSKTIMLAKMRDVEGGRMRVGNDPGRDARRKDNNNPRTRGDFFYLNSLRRVLFYVDDKCTSESQVNGMESHSTELSKQRTSTTAMTTG